MAASALLALTAFTIIAVQAQVYTGQDGVYTITQDTGADVPLASKVFAYPDLPYQADSGTGDRGTQQGYNICNSTTLGENSWCQTAIINSAEDFCLWGAPVPNTTVGAVEEEMVAYCTTAKYGTRVIPPGALTGVQFVQTPDYVEIAGYIDQTALNLQADDAGGEEDPHGDDERGNPLGSLLYSSAFGNGPLSNFTQIHEWSYFVGGGVFCFKACDPAGPNAAALCAHIYDRIGCTYNDPVDYASINGTFASCLGEDMTPPGVYVSDGVTTTYTEPPESLGPITTVPYTPTIPATSSCTTYESSSLYTLMAQYAASVSGGSVTTSASSATSTPTGTAAKTTGTGASSAAAVSGAKAAAAATSSKSSSSTSAAEHATALRSTSALVAAAIAAGFVLAFAV